MTVRNNTCAADAMQRQHENFMKLCELSYEGFGYDFSLTKFKSGIRSVVEVVCPKHGVFRTRAKKLLAGRGCTACNDQSLMDHDGMVYVIRCQGNNEMFYKVGITTKTLDVRFGERNLMPYEYEVLSLFTGDRKKLYKFEAILKRKLKQFSYKPKIDFAGSSTECFSSIEPIRDKIEVSSIISVDLFKRHI